MSLGLILYDLIFVILATGIYAGALAAVVRAFAWLAALIPWPLACFPAAYVGFFVLVAEVSVLTALCPKLTPGRYKLFGGLVFYGWIFRSALRRVLFVPGVKWFLFASNVLRFFTLRGLGAKVAFTTSMSADVDLLDPSLVAVGPGSIFGARCIITGHFVEAGCLVLGEVRVGKNSMLAADVMCAPSVTIGDDVIVKARVDINVGTRIGSRARIGASSFLDSNVTVAPGGVVGNYVYIARRTEVLAVPNEDTAPAV